TLSSLKQPFFSVSPRRWALSFALRFLLLLLVYAAFVLLLSYVTSIDPKLSLLAATFSELARFRETSLLWATFSPLLWAIEFAAFFELLNRSFDNQLIAGWVKGSERFLTKRRYADFQAATNIIAFLNPISALEDRLLIMRGDWSESVKRSTVEEMPAGQPASDMRRVSLATTL